jgi:urease subunit gamma
MIDIKVWVQGETDTPPFVKVFQYPDKEEESIFFNTIASIKKKIGMGLKINTYETLVFYCTYLIEQMRAHKSLEQIEKAAQSILSRDQVLIGVPETLREMSFDAIVDDFPEQRIKFIEPMKISNYMMT